jgi:hypothetical protein
MSHQFAFDEMLAHADDAHRAALDELRSSDRVVRVAHAAAAGRPRIVGQQHGAVRYVHRARR